jgi:cystathionine gamma-lyase
MPGKDALVARGTNCELIILLLIIYHCYIIAISVNKMYFLSIIVIIIAIIQLVSSDKSIGFGTKIVHHGCDVDEETGGIIPSIQLGTTFAQHEPGVRPGKENLNSFGQGYFYSRFANPTRGALERALAAAENAKHCFVFSSGMAAISTITQLLKSGDHVIALDDLYGGTSTFFREIAAKNGVDFSFLDMTDPAVVENAITEKTKLIFLETPTNPLLKTTDIRAIAEIAKRKGCLLAIDCTFCSPYLLNALDLGADIVMHSCTKYIAGHSDVLMGCIMVNDDDISKRLRFLQAGIGAVPSPFECYLALRGLKTLHLRMEASQKSAIAIADFLEKHPLIEKVIYPGLKSYKYYDLAKSQTKGPGAMISFYIKGGIPVARKFLKKLKIFALAVSLGAVESLICSPAIMTHASVPIEKREAIGLTDDLIRVSVGIEDTEDLINDLNNALNEASHE